MRALLDRALAATMLVALFIPITGCGGEDPAGAGLPEPETTTTLELTPSGGAWRVPANDGSELHVSLPAGAVDVPVTIEITPEEPLDGGFARFRIETPPVVLREPARLTLTLSGGMPADAIFSLEGPERRSLLATELDLGAGTAEASLDYLGRPSETATRDIAEGAIWLGLDEMLCQTELESAKAMLVQAQNDEWYPYTVKECMDTIEALIFNCEQEPFANLRQVIVNQAKQTNDEAHLAAFNSPHDLDEEKVRKRIHPLVASSALAALVASDDEDQINQKSDEAIAHLLNNYINNMKAQVDEDEYLENTLYSKVWYQLRRFTAMEAEADLLEQDKAAQRLRELQTLNLDQIRRAAYHECQDTKQQFMLADLHSGGQLGGQPFLPGLEEVPPPASFTSQDLIADMHWAVTDISLEFIDGVSGAHRTDNQLRRFAGGQEPGEVIRLDSPVTVSAYGAIAVSGDVWAFMCAPTNGAPGDWDDQQIILKLNGDVFDTLHHGGDGRFLEVERSYLVEDILTRIGLGIGYDYDLELEVFRTGSSCGEHYGSGDFLIGTLEVEIPQITTSVAGEWSLSVDEVCEGSISITQQGSSLSVSGSVGGNPGCGYPTLSGSGTGMLDGNSVSMGIAFSALGEATFAGTVNDAGTSMAGNWSGSAGSGTWQATRATSADSAGAQLAPELADLLLDQRRH